MKPEVPTPQRPPEKRQPHPKPEVPTPVRPPEKRGYFEMANRIVAEAAILRAQGKGHLVRPAWDYDNAVLRRVNEENNVAALRSILGREIPEVFLESLQTAKASERAALEIFARTIG